MLNLTTKFGARVDKCLREEEVIWFTTVSSNGTPQPNPVWFFWDGVVITTYSKPDAFRIRNIRKNTKVSLSLQGADALGNNVVIIIGEATLNPDYDALLLGYVEKYQRYFPIMNVTVADLATAYSVEITVKPLKVRGA